MSGLCECFAFYLSEELIEEILKRLPAKSLLKFMSVCKSWYSLINSPLFIATHLDHQLNIEAPRYVLYKELIRDSSRYFVHLDNDDFDEHLELDSTRLMNPSFFMVDSCNGIFCIGRRHAPHALLWNPSIGKSLDLVVPYNYDRRARYSYGFGFDATANDYKVVVLVKNIPPSDGWEMVRKLNVFYVYSLTTGSWKRSNVYVEIEGHCYIKSKGVHLNGVIYWLLSRASGDNNSVLMFNLEDETTLEIPLPRAMINELYPLYEVEIAVMMLEGSARKLDVVLFYVRNASFKLWGLEVEGTTKSWRKVILGEFYPKRFVNARTNGEIMFELEDVRVISLNLKNMSIKHIQCDHRLEYMGTYVESLVLLEQCRAMTNIEEYDGGED